MVNVERKLKITTEQHNIDKPSQMEGFPMKEWTIEIYLLDEEGNEHPAKCFNKVTYHLHPSFAQPVQTFYEPPFRCTNEGWGEFEMTIDCFTTEKSGKIQLAHDLNFAAPTYDVEHTVTFRNPSQALQAILRETGPIPLDDAGAGKKKAGGLVGAGESKKRSKTGFDLEKMADGLVRLNEDDILQVIQMIHDNKSEDTITKNDVEAGEYTVDLASVPDHLSKMIWDFLESKKVLS